MAVSFVSLSDNVTNSLNYAGSPTKAPKVKSKDPKFLKLVDGHHQRVLLSSSINCSSNPKVAAEQMKPVIQKYQRGKSQCVTSVISFKNLDYRNRKDWYKAMKIDKETMKMKFPSAQVACYLQADNKGHVLHVHNIICGYNATNGKSNIANDSWGDIAHDLDTVEKRHGITPVHNGLTRHSTGLRPQFNDGYKVVHTSHAVANRIRSGKYSWVNDIRQRISNACYNTNPITNHLTNKDFYNFRNNLRNNGVHIEMFSMRKNKRTDKREIHVYKSKPKQRAVPVTHTNPTTHNRSRVWLKLRKHWSYSFRPNGKGTKKYVIREKRLGTAFNNVNIIHNFGKPLIQNNQIKNTYAKENTATINEIKKAPTPVKTNNPTKFKSNTSNTPNKASLIQERNKVIQHKQNINHKMTKLLVDDSIKNGSFVNPEPQLTMTSNNKSRDEDDGSSDTEKIINQAHKEYIDKMSQQISQQKNQITGYHFIKEYSYNMHRNPPFQSQIFGTHKNGTFKVPTFRTFKCLGNHTMPQIIYGKDIEDIGQDQQEIADRAYNESDDDTQKQIQQGATEVDQADAKDLYNLRMAQFRAKRRERYEGPQPTL